MYFLVYRDENRETVRIEAYTDLYKAIYTRNLTSLSWFGEVVFCGAKDLETLYQVFGEYKPKVTLKVDIIN